MNETIKFRLLYIMHRAWVECRLLAQQGEAKQAEQLADLMELVPGIIAFGRIGDLPTLANGLADYASRYSTRFDYLAALNSDPPAQF